MDATLSAAALWWAVVGSGIYHGVNPGMGWPLAVSAALMDRKPASLPKALGVLALGHFLAMTAILLPFSMLLFLVEWQNTLQTISALMVIAMGIYLVINRRHPRFLARVSPAKLGLWSFLAAMAHGAGLMLVPIYLGICQTVDTNAGHAAAEALMGSNIGIALIVAVVHTLAMMLSGGALAVGVYRWLGLKFLSKGWFNLDLVWAISLILVGMAALMVQHGA